MSSRPTKHELSKKLKEANEAIKSGCVRFSNPSKVVGELYNLNLGDNSEIWDLIVKLLEEIKIEDYTGKYPPELAYEKVIQGKDLWAFCWSSALLKKKMYLKFAYKNNIFYYVSLHESRYA